MKDFNILRFSIRHSAVRFGCRAPPALAAIGQIENCCLLAIAAYIFYRI